MKWIICFIWVVTFTKDIHSIEFKVFGNLTQANEFGCNTQVIIQCIVNPKTDPVFWQVGKPVTPLSDLAAECSGFLCTVYSSSYDFSYDENAGESNLTIENVTLADDGKQYRCANSSTSAIFDAVVLVPPIKETTQISNMTVAEVAKTTIITVSTGCVTNRTARRVTFKWFIIPENGSVAVYKEATPPSISDDSACQINSDCISDGSVALSNNFTITEDATASKVYFQVQILLDGDLLFSVNTTSTFQPQSGQDSTTNTNPFTNHTVVGTTSATVSFSTEVGSNATTETVTFNTTENSTVYPSSENFKTTYIFVITIIVVVVLGAVVVVLYLFVLRRKKNRRKSDKSDSNSKHTSIRFKKEQQNE